MNVKGQECPVCGKLFEEDSDVVVCPECGTLHHRKCYFESGECFNKSKHGSGWSWESPKYEFEEKFERISEEKSKYQNSRKCVKCGQENDPIALFCKNCGLPFRVPYSDEEIMDGVTEDELARYIKINAPYYISIAQKIKKTGKSKFNFSAFLFMGNWLILRKKYVLGIIISMVSFAMWMISLVITNNQIAKINEFVGYRLDDLSMQEFVAKGVEYINSVDLGTQLLFMLPFTFMVILFLGMLLFGLLSNRLYLNSCVKKIRNIKKIDRSKEEIQKLINTSGGVNTKLAVYVFAVIMFAMQIVKFIL